MAVNNFIPEVWAARLRHRLFAWSAFLPATNTEYEGDVMEYGDTVRIFQLDDDVEVKNYTRNTDIDDPDLLNTTEQTLAINQQKYFHVAIDDLDKRQIRADLIDRAVDNTTRKAAQVIDDYVASKLEAVPSNELGINKAKADFDLDITAEIRKWAAEKNLPCSHIRIITSPGVIEKLDKSFIDGTFREVGWMRSLGGSMPFAMDPAEGMTNGMGQIASAGMGNTMESAGFVDNFNGFPWYVSNNNRLKTFTGTGNNRVQNGHVLYAFDRRDVALVTQVAQVEGYRPEKRFADAVKGLYLYDAKVLKNDRILKFTLNL